MTNPTQTVVHEHYPDPHHDLYTRTTFGFWVFLLTDFVLFGTLFAVYAVLSKSTYGGPSPQDLFRAPMILWPAIVLLISGWTAGLGATAAHRKDKKLTSVFFLFTFVLGIIFTWMEVADLLRLIKAGHGWEKSAFLSAYFTIVGTHTVHMFFALFWVFVLLIPLWLEKPMSHISVRRFVCLKMFWQFLNIIWIFIFSFVFLMGVV